MKLNLELGNSLFQMEIKKWQKPIPKEDWYGGWPQIMFSLKGEYINYSVDDQFLQSIDVIGLRDILHLFLDGELKQEHSLAFDAPDLLFLFHPAKRYYNGQHHSLYPNGFLGVDLTMDITVTFRWENQWANTFTARLDRERIDAMFAYLQFVTEELSESSERVSKYINAGMLTA